MRSRWTSSRWMLLVASVVLVLPALLTVVSGGSDADPVSGGGAKASENDAERAVVLYYFHGTRRCNTCEKIESYAQLAIEDNYAAELESGTLLWKPLNTDEPDNAHFVTDFGLVSSSLVVVEMNGGEVVRHRVLQDAWTLVRDEPRFIQYVRRSVHEFLD